MTYHIAHASAADSTNSLSPPLQWSVVIITRDEEAVINDCLQSVMSAFANRSYEVILVDSASTDRTVEIAKKFDTKIVQLPPNVPLRPAVGRHVGLQLAKGEWVLFLDGDSQLDPTWVDHAAAALSSDPDLAGVAGEMQHILQQQSSEQTNQTHTEFAQTYPKIDYSAAEHLDGSAAYKRSALQRTGGFNPHLHSLEEAELGGRLRKYGYHLRRLPYLMTRHYPKHRNETVTELFRRIGRGYYKGPGQFLRHCLKYGLHYDIPNHKPLNRIARYLQMLALLILGVVALGVSIFYSRIEFFLAWLGLMALVYIAYVIHAKNFRKPAFYLFEWAITGPIMVWGFLKPPRAAHEFPNLIPRSAIINKGVAE